MSAKWFQGRAEASDKHLLQEIAELRRQLHDEKLSRRVQEVRNAGALS